MATPGEDQDTGAPWCDEQERADLIARYGDQLHAVADTMMVMGLVGCTETGMERWAIGFRYDTAEAFTALTDANRRFWGHETLGPATGPDGQLYGLLIPYRADGITQEELSTRFAGQTQVVDTAMVTALLGRDDVDPASVVGCRYATREAFDAYAEANRRHHGHETLGPAEGTDGALYGLIVLSLPDPAEPGAGQEAAPGA